ncbi:hypothetical protein [Actinocorallia longicatena]|uniref:Uncharacterized protein n=1 Tax=Actinocorallia longicatena TaxID=111803 RepID=A0ABP6QCS6_9ACTN
MGTGQDRGTGPSSAVVAAFWDDMRMAFEAAGPPTYPRLVRIMKEQAARNGGRTLGKSALQSMMTGKNIGLPCWEVLSAVISALHVAAAETRLDPADVGGIPDWHARLLDAKNGSAEPVHGDSPASSGEAAPPLSLVGKVHPVDVVLRHQPEDGGPENEDVLYELTMAAHDEDHPDHGQAAFGLAVLAMCRGGAAEGEHWLKVSALAGCEPARALICARDRHADAVAAARKISDTHMTEGRIELALVFLKATRTAA